MSKKHFETIAAILAHRRNDPNGTAAEREDRRLTADEIATDLADYFATTNPLFSRARFLAACRGDL